MKNEFKNNYSKKILTQDALKKVLGKNREKKKLYYVTEILMLFIQVM